MKYYTVTLQISTEVPLAQLKDKELWEDILSYDDLNLLSIDVKETTRVEPDSGGTQG